LDRKKKRRKTVKTKKIQQKKQNRSEDLESYFKRLGDQKGEEKVLEGANMKGNLEKKNSNEMRN